MTGAHPPELPWALSRARPAEGRMGRLWGLPPCTPPPAGAMTVPKQGLAKVPSPMQTKTKIERQKKYMHKPNPLTACRWECHPSRYYPAVFTRTGEGLGGADVCCDQLCLLTPAKQAQPWACVKVYGHERKILFTQDTHQAAGAQANTQSCRQTPAGACQQLYFPVSSTQQHLLARAPPWQLLAHRQAGG